MISTPTDLLKLLDARLGAAAGAASQALAGPAAVPFADLLAKAQKGELHSGFPVEIDRDANVTLNEEQLARLSKAADAAEAAGLHTAAVLIDGMSLSLDVHTRRITGTLDLQAGVVRGIDGIVQAPGTGDELNGVGAGASTGLVKLPGMTSAGTPAPSANASVNALLAALQRPSGAAAA